MARGGTDVIIIGGGHNGLVCAYYLATAGLKVNVFERRNIVGGAAVTEEFYPGFRNSMASYTVSLLNPKIIADMDLEGHGLRIVDRKLQNFLPVDDRQYLATGGERTRPEVAKFSSRDADKLSEYERRMNVLADLVRSVLLKTPPNATDKGWVAALLELLGAVGFGRSIAKLDMPARRDLLTLFAQSAGDMLDGWFESDPIKAVLGWDAIVGNYTSPYAPGTAYVLLHHCFGQTNGKKGLWGHAIGGMGAITQAMAKACTEKGVRIFTGSAVGEVVTRRGRAIGIVLEDGETHHARAVASNLNPKLLFHRLVDKTLLPEDFRARMDSYRCASGTFRMNVALSELPRFTCLPQPGDHLTAGIIIGPSLAYFEKAYRDARAFGWSREPVVEMLIPSTLDDTLAPKNRHVASLFCQHVAPELPDGKSWDDYRETVADLMIETVDRRAPGFKASVIARHSYSPLDLERTFGLVGGDIMHGALTLDQIFSARPTLGYAAYRAPVKGLYICGSGTHPGGGVTGAPGYNAAREIAKDFRRRAV